MRILYFIFLLLFICSCDSSRQEDANITSFLKQTFQANSVSVSSKGDTAFITMEMKPNRLIADEYLSSTVLVSYHDTIKTQKEKWVSVAISDSFGSQRYLYLWENVPSFKNYMQQTIFITNAIMSSKTQEMKEMVDSTMISDENLDQLNVFGYKIKEDYDIRSMSFDGFKVDQGGRVIQVQARLSNEDESIPLQYQYNINTHLLTYFSINGE